MRDGNLEGESVHPAVLCVSNLVMDLCVDKVGMRFYGRATQFGILERKEL